MQSAKDKMVIDENGEELVPIDLADIDKALAGVRSIAPAGWTANDCYVVYKEWVGGKHPFEIDRDRKGTDLKSGVKSIVAAIQFMRYKVGLGIDPQVEQHKLVAYTKFTIGGLTQQLHESASTIESINKIKKQFEEQVSSVIIKDLTKDERVAFLSDLGFFSSILDLRQKEIKTMTALTSQIFTANNQLSVLTGANIAAKKTANKQKGQTLEDKLDTYDDATIQKIIDEFGEEVVEEFSPKVDAD
jgi:hypothetical protein